MLLPRDDKDSFDIFDDHIFEDDRAAETHTWRSGKNKVIDLKATEWKLALIDISEDVDEETASDDQHESLPAARARKSNALSSDMDIDQLHRGATSHSQCQERSDPRHDSRHNPSPGQYALGPLQRKRSLPRNHPESERVRLKPICVHCWTTSSWCDFYGQCGSCRIAGIQCVRKHCSIGLGCRNPRCPCMHPGQWDETDETWVVEVGPLPRRDSMF